MKGLLIALKFFFAGLLGAAGLYFGLKFILVPMLGDRLLRLPEIQMERLALVLENKPVTTASVLILGDSTAEFSLDAAGLRDAYSLGLVNSTSIEAYTLLSRALESGAHPRCLLTSFSFTWELNRGFFWSMFVANRFYSNAELDEIYRVSRDAGELPGKWGRAHFATRRFFAETSLDDGYTSRRFQEALASSAWPNVRANGTRYLLARHKGSSPLVNAAAFEGRLDLTFAGDPQLTRTEEEYFRRFLALAEKHKIRLLFLEMPFAQSVPATVGASFWQRFEALLAQIKPGMQWKFVRPPSMEDPFFISAGHLTREGGQKMQPFVQSALDANGCYP